MANSNFTCTLSAWRSGQTLYAKMTYSRSGSYYYYDTSFPDPTMNLGGVTYTDTAFGNAVRSGVYVGSVSSTTFSRTVGGTGNRTVTWTAGSGQRSDFAGSWSQTVNFPVTNVAPNTPTVSAATVDANSINVTYGTTSFGTPSTGTVALYGDTASTPTTQINTKTTTGNSTFNHTGLTGNTTYYYRSRAANSALNSNFSSTASATTYPVAPTITVNSTDYQSALISIASPIQGSAQTMNVYYSLDGGADVLAGTVTSGNFIPVSLNLPPNTSHTITAYIQTTVGDSATTTATFRTKLPFYGSVSSQTKEITKLYGSVGGQTKLIQHLYGPVGHQVLDSVTGEIRAGGAENITAFDAGDFYTTISADSTLMDYAMDRTVDYLVLNYDSDNSEWTLTLGFDNGDTYLVSDDQGPYTLAELGITANLTTNGDDYIDLVGTYETIYKSKLIF